MLIFFNVLSLLKKGQSIRLKSRFPCSPTSIDHSGRSSFCTFQATGVTTYLENGGTLENAQVMAAHESPRTTRLYDRRGDEISLDEVERIVI